jgi:hypothetical protein
MIMGVYLDITSGLNSSIGIQHSNSCNFMQYQNEVQQTNSKQQGNASSSSLIYSMADSTAITICSCKYKQQQPMNFTIFLDSHAYLRVSTSSQHTSSCLTLTPNRFRAQTQWHGIMNIKQTLTNQPNKHGNPGQGKFM